MLRVTARTCTRARRCECGAAITPGQRYLEHVAAPRHGDLGNVRWLRMAACQGCAERRGRGSLLAESDVPAEPEDGAR